MFKLFISVMCLSLLTCGAADTANPENNADAPEAAKVNPEQILRELLKCEEGQSTVVCVEKNHKHQNVHEMINNLKPEEKKAIKEMFEQHTHHLLAGMAKHIRDAGRGAESKS